MQQTFAARRRSMRRGPDSTPYSIHKIYLMTFCAHIPEQSIAQHAGHDAADQEDVQHQMLHRFEDLLDPWKAVDTRLK